MECGEAVMGEEGRRPTAGATTPKIESEPDRQAAGGGQSYAELPDRIRLEDMITEQATRDPGDPTFGGRETHVQAG